MSLLAILKNNLIKFFKKSFTGIQNDIALNSQIKRKSLLNSYYVEKQQ